MSSLSSQQQPLSQNEEAALSPAGELNNSAPVDGSEMKPLEQGLVETNTVESVSAPAVPVVEQPSGAKSVDVSTESDEIEQPVYPPQSDMFVNDVIVEDDVREREALVELDEDRRDQDKALMEEEAKRLLAEEQQPLEDADDGTEFLVEVENGEENPDRPESAFSRSSLVAELEGVNQDGLTDSESQLVFERKDVSLDGARVPSMPTSQPATLVCILLHLS